MTLLESPARPWRARIGDHLTDMTNRTRAKDAAQCIAASNLNGGRETQRSPRIRDSDRAATSVHAST
jgi:hypothetical protein